MKIVTPFAALAALLPLVPAVAEAPARTQVVRFAYPEATSPDGRVTLDRRIQRAAAAVCGEAFDFDPAGQNDVRRCRKATVAAATQTLAQTLAARGSVVTVVASR